MSKNDRRPKRKRRLFRYGLRSFFVLVLVIAICLGWYVYRVEQQKVVIQWVREHGGTIDYRYDSLFEDSVERPKEEWLRKRFDDDYVVDVAVITFENAQDTELSAVQDLQPLARLCSLKSLNLADTNVSNIGPLRRLLSRGAQNQPHRGA